jgi:hypothetical protein
MKITLQELENIMGMPSIGKQHVRSLYKDHMELWKNIKDPEDTKIILKRLLKKMEKDNSPNFVRPFVLYTIGKYLCPTTQDYKDNKYLGIV